MAEAAFSPRFTDAYDKDTGDKYRIPVGWLDHPVLGARFRKTPKVRGGSQQRPVTDDSPNPASRD